MVPRGASAIKSPCSPQRYREPVKTNAREMSRREEKQHSTSVRVLDFELGKRTPVIFQHLKCNSPVSEPSV